MKKLVYLFAVSVITSYSIHYTKLYDSPNMVHTDFTNGIFHDASTTDYNQDYLQRAIVASIDAIKSAEASSDYRMVSWEELPETWVSKTTQLSPES